MWSSHGVTWQVRRPLPPPREVSSELRILAPGDGATFRSLHGKIVLHPRANRRHGLVWFLDGGSVVVGQIERLIVMPGIHELRCVDASGGASAVTFRVR